MTTQAVGNGVTLEQLGFDLKPQEASNAWGGQLTILAGPPKVGKSTFLAQGGEKAWFIRMAPEFRDLTTYGVDCRDYDDVIREVDKLHKAANAGVFPWDTIVFDPGDKFLQFVTDKICDDYKVDSIFDVPGFGVGWNKYKAAIKAFVSSITKLPAHTFFCFHTKVKELSEPSNESKKYHKWCLDVSEKLDAEFIKRFDNVLNVMIGYVGKMQARSMVTQGTKFIEAGCKAPCLKKLPSIPWTENDKANFDKFRSMFDNK